jgi:uncharacterized RDD family membrane protein YckC
MSKSEEILQRNRQRSEKRVQQGPKPESPNDLLERVIDGGALLVMWGAFLILGLIVFAISSVIGMIIFQGAINGLILGAVVTFGAGYVLYKLGAYF